MRCTVNIDTAFSRINPPRQLQIETRKARIAAKPPSLHSHKPTSAPEIRKVLFKLHSEPIHLFFEFYICGLMNHRVS